MGVDGVIMKWRLNLFLVILLVLPLASGEVVLYNSSEPGNFIVKEDGSLSDEPPPANSLPPDAGTNVSGGEYSALSESDDSDYTLAVNDDDESYTYANVTISETFISQLNWTVEAALTDDGEGSDEVIYFYAWNHSASQWFDCSFNVTSSSDTTQSCILSSVASDFVNDNDETYFMAYGSDPNDVGSLTPTMRLDFLGLAVTPDSAANFSVNTTGGDLLHITNFTANITVMDDVGLSNGTIYSNASGVWQAEYTMNLSGTVDYLTASINISSNKSELVCWNASAVDTAGNENQSGLSCFTVGNTVPKTPSGLMPFDDSSFGTEQITFNFSSVDNDPGDSITYFLFLNESTNPDTLYYSGTDENFTTDLLNGTYYWTVIASDGGDNSTNSTPYVFTIDTTIPGVTLIDVNNTFFNHSTINLTFQVDDTDMINNCSLWTNTTGSWALNQTNFSTPTGQQLNFEINQSDGVYLWNVQCFDSGDTGAFASNNFTFTIDTVEPLITINQPTGTKSSRTSISASFSVTDINADNCSYWITLGGNLQNDPGNVSLGCDATTATFDVGLDGDFVFNLLANDSAGNSVLQTSAFTVDTSGDAGTGGGGGSTTTVVTGNATNVCGNRICEEAAPPQGNSENSFNCAIDCPKPGFQSLFSGGFLKDNAIAQIAIFGLLTALLLLGVNRTEKKRKRVAA